MVLLLFLKISLKFHLLEKFIFLNSFLRVILRLSFLTLEILFLKDSAAFSSSISSTIGQLGYLSFKFCLIPFLTVSLISEYLDCFSLYSFWLCLTTSIIDDPIITKIINIIFFLITSPIIKCLLKFH